MRTEELELEYLGEPSARKPLVAFLLSLLAPGMGWAYLGRPATAVALNALVVGMICLGLVLFHQLLFFPLFPFLVLLCGVFVICVMSGGDAARWAQDHGERHVLRDSNHPVAYLLIYGMSWALPLAGIMVWLATVSWAIVVVEDERMYPTLVQGDWLLVQRERAGLASPQRGEVVVYRRQGRIAPGRVIALGGDEVTFAEDIPYVNDAPLPREPLDTTSRDALVDLAGALPGLDFYSERNTRLSWASVMPALMTLGDVEELRLNEREVYVVNDHRGLLEDSRTWGAIEMDELVGRPVFVLFSREVQGVRGMRWSRIGRRVQSPGLSPGALSAGGL